MENIQITLNKGKSVHSTNVDNYVSVNLLGNDKLLLNNDIQTSIDEYQQYLSEKNKSNKFRLIFTINPICSNVLFNRITELVYAEGSDECKLMTSSTDNEISSSLYFQNFKGELSSLHDATTKDTAFSSVLGKSNLDNLYGFNYNCGIDIFNNHHLRRKDFVVVNPLKNEQEKVVIEETTEKVVGDVSYKNNSSTFYGTSNLWTELTQNGGNYPKDKYNITSGSMYAKIKKIKITPYNSSGSNMPGTYSARISGKLYIDNSNNYICDYGTNVVLNGYGSYYQSSGEYTLSLYNTKSYNNYTGTPRIQFSIYCDISHTISGGYSCEIEYSVEHVRVNYEYYETKEIYEYKYSVDNNFNTIFDSLRDKNGNIEQGLIDQGSDSEKQLHLYDKNIIFSAKDLNNFGSILDYSLQEQNGWFGFMNKSIIPINVNNKINNGGEIYLNKIMCDRRECDFIDMYPDRTLFSFVPKWNKYRRRAEYNWKYYITYPYENDIAHPLVLNGIPGSFDLSDDNQIIYDVNTDTFDYETGNIRFRTDYKHNLSKGSLIHLSLTLTDEYSGSTVLPKIYDIPYPIEVNGVGKYGYDDNHYFSINFDDISYCLTDYYHLIKNASTNKLQQKRSNTRKGDVTTEWDDGDITQGGTSDGNQETLNKCILDGGDNWYEFDDYDKYSITESLDKDNNYSAEFEYSEKIIVNNNEKGSCTFYGFSGGISVTRNSYTPEDGSDFNGEKLTIKFVIDNNIINTINFETQNQPWTNINIDNISDFVYDLYYGEHEVKVVVTLSDAQNTLDNYRVSNSIRFEVCQFNTNIDTPEPEPDPEPETPIIYDNDLFDFVTIKSNVKRIYNNKDCKYYIRKFKRVPNFKNTKYSNLNNIDDSIINDVLKINDFSSTINKLAFSKNIYGDDMSQIVFDDDIDVTGLRDNLGRELTTLYLTIVKNNTGHEKWYNENGNRSYSDSDIEYSRCFSKVTSGFDLPEYVYDYNVHRLHNISKEGFSNGDGYWEKYPTLNIKSVDCNDSGDTYDISTLHDVFYGDIVEFEEDNLNEIVLETIQHRFNTAQRESLLDIYSSLTVDEIVSDDYDYSGWNTNTYNLFNNESINCRANIAPEGYYYQAHYPIKIKEFDNKINEGYHTLINFIDNYSGDTINYDNGSYYYVNGVKLDKNYYFNSGDTIYCISKKNLNKIIGTVSNVVFNNDGTTQIDIINLNIPTGFSLNIIDYILFKPNILKPLYAYDLNDGTGKYIWKDIKKYEYISRDSELYDSTFTNDAHYIYKQINFYLKRQDPIGIYGLQPSYDNFGDDITKAYASIEIDSEIKDVSISEYFEEGENNCTFVKI